MLYLPGSQHRLCGGLSRRDFLHIAGLGAAGVTLPGSTRAEQTKRATSDGFGKAKACILLFMGGGPSQLGTFDLKPDAPAEIRGDFTPIATSVPGIRISDHLPLLAKQAGKYAIVRSVTDDYIGGAHGQSIYRALTGHHSPRVQGDDVRPSSEDYPCLGSALSRFRPGDPAIPPFVWLLDMYRHTFAGEGAGSLGKKHDPFRMLQDPSRPNFTVQALTPAKEVSLERVAGRRGLLDQVSRQLDQRLHSRRLAGMDSHYERAFNMIAASKFHKAFDLNAEPAPVRDAYGRTKFGQGTLLARRLVEHGVPLVTVFWNGTERDTWDTHYEETRGLKVLLPPTDRAVSTLLVDLQARGLLDDTLVVWMGEFGRAPRLEAKGGRGHWGRCYSVVLAGAGVRGGQVIGTSDRQAAYPARDPVGPADIVTTIYHSLGIATDTQFTDHLGRPFKLGLGTAIRSLFA